MIQTKNQAGRSMVEMIAVLMIIGILTVGALAGLSQAMDKYRVAKMHTDIQSMSSDVVNLYSWKRGYPNSGKVEVEMKAFKKTLCENDVFPDGCDSTNKAFNPYGGEYNITTNTDNQTMTVTATSVPSVSCEDLRQREWSYVAIAPTCTSAESATQTFTIVFY